jgi:hypothetical protein
MIICPRKHGELLTKENHLNDQRLEEYVDGE